jgi:hypothetical protein
MKNVGKKTSEEFKNLQKVMIDGMIAEMSRLHSEFKRLDDIKVDTSKLI